MINLINPVDVLRLDVVICYILFIKRLAPTTQWGVTKYTQLCIVVESWNEPLESLGVSHAHDCTNKNCEQEPYRLMVGRI